MLRWIFKGDTGWPRDEEVPLEDDLDAMEKSAREADMKGPLRAIEAFQGEDDDGPALWIRGIYEQASWYDSRYTLNSIAHYETEHAPQVVEMGRALAACLGVEFDACDRGGPSWIERQGPSPERDFKMAWRARWWAEDGVEHREEGPHDVRATDLEEAHQAVHEHVGDSIDPDALFIECEVRNPVTGEWRWAYPVRLCVPGSWESTLASMEISAQLKQGLQQGIRQGMGPSGALRDVRARCPETPFTLMKSVASAFEMKVRDLGCVGAWARGEITDVELDRDLGPRIQATEVKWNGKHSLRTRLSRGERLSDLLHEYCERRQTYGYVEVIGLVEGALGYWHAYSDAGEKEEDAAECMRADAACKTEVSAWLDRGRNAGDDALDEATAPLVDRYVLRRSATG